MTATEPGPEPLERRECETAVIVSRLGDISIYGQESKYTTRRLANMNLAIRGIGANIAQGDSFHADAFPDLKADTSGPIRPSTTATGAARCCATTSAGSTARRLRATPTLSRRATRTIEKDGLRRWTACMLPTATSAGRTDSRRRDLRDWQVSAAGQLHRPVTISRYGDDRGPSVATPHAARRGRPEREMDSLAPL